VRIVATFGWKYEPKWLIDDLKKNLWWVDDFAIIDCRHRTDELWIDEGEYRRLQRAECERLGADWVLVTSADERWEDRAPDVIRPLVDGIKRRTIFRFPLREMWTPTEYRVDAIWGRKTRPRLYPLLPGQQMSQKRIQASPVPFAGGYHTPLVDLNIYHLKMIEPENRVTRAEVFEALDPQYEHQTRNGKKSKRRRRLDPEGLLDQHGYHYLHVEDGLQLESIPDGRGYSPPYTKRYVFKVPKRLLSV
jgi:hypothetical protein